MSEYELLNNAEEYKEITTVYVDEVYVKRDSVLYNGFFGKNGFNNIEIVFELNGKYYKTPRYKTDLITLNTANKFMGIDCPHDCKYLRLFTWERKICFSLRLGLSNIDIDLVGRPTNEKSNEF